MQSAFAAAATVLGSARTDDRSGKGGGAVPQAGVRQPAEAVDEHRDHPAPIKATCP